MSDRLAQLLKLHEADPVDPFCTYAIGLEYAKAGRHDEALAWLDKTIGLDDRYCYAYFQKARLLIERGDEATARQVLQDGMQAARAAGDEHAYGELAGLLQTLA